MGGCWIVCACVSEFTKEEKSRKREKRVGKEKKEQEKRKNSNKKKKEQEKSKKRVKRGRA